MTEREREASDEDLARAAGRGELAAFQSLVARHQRRIYSLALRLVRDPTEAEDMAQTAFLRIFRGLGSFRGEARFSTWMVRVALNTFHRHLRRMPKDRPLPEPELTSNEPAGVGQALHPVSGHPDPEAQVLANEEAARLRRLVSGLPPHFRDAVTVFYLHERSLEEAASALGISHGTLKSRLFRARELLLRRWQQGSSCARRLRGGVAFPEAKPRRRDAPGSRAAQQNNRPGEARHRRPIRGSRRLPLSTLLRFLP